MYVSLSLSLYIYIYIYTNRVSTRADVTDSKICSEWGWVRRPAWFQ